jgi:hypothetical protein
LVFVTRQPSTQTRHGAKLVRLERTLSEEKYGAAMRLNGVPGPSSNAQIASASRQLSRRAPTGWLGREGSNLRMAESKSGAAAFDFNDYSELS